jgi:hypothetical protein
MILTIPDNVCVGGQSAVNISLSIHTPMVVETEDSQLTYTFGGQTRRLSFKSTELALEYLEKFDLYLNHSKTTEPELFL